MKAAWQLPSAVLIITSLSTTPACAAAGVDAATAVTAPATSVLTASRRVNSLSNSIIEFSLQADPPLTVSANRNASQNCLFPISDFRFPFSARNSALIPQPVARRQEYASRCLSTPFLQMSAGLHAACAKLRSRSPDHQRA